MRKILMGGVCLLSVLAFGARGFAQGQAQGSSAPTIISMKGEVSVNLAGQKWETAQKNIPLNENTVIKTDTDSSCTIAFDSLRKNTVSIGPNSEVKIEKYFKRVRISNGRVFTLMKGLEAGSKFEVATPHAIAGVRGTAWETVVGKDFTQFNVTDNTIYVEGLGFSGEMTGEGGVVQGHSITIGEDGKLGDVTELSGEDKTRLGNWSNEIEGSLQKSSDAPGVEGYTPPAVPAAVDVDTTVRSEETARDISPVQQ